MSMKEITRLEYIKRMSECKKKNIEVIIIDPEKDYGIVDQKEKHPNENQKT